MSTGKVIASKSKTLPDEWDIPTLLHLTDAVRSCVTSGTKLSKDKIEFLETVLQKLLDEDKQGKQQTIPFIAQSRIELLVRDIVITGMQTKDPRSDTPNTLELKCFALQRCWRKNFRPSYFVTTIDEVRHNSMEEISLKNVTFDPKEGRWTVQDAKSEHHSHTEGSLDFKPGQWWLNLACCYRDGIVGSMIDDLTKGPYGVTAMPLLSGEELESSIPGCFTYRRVGPIQDMYISLMSQLGQKHVRILRGYKLKSPNAPKGGIRYDGLYTPIEYSHSLDTTTNLYEVKLLFRRDEDTPRVETLSNIPSPSQMDEWKLYLLMAVNEKEDSRPNRPRFEPQGKEERGSGLLKSAEFREALKSESPSHVKTPSATPPKKKLVAQGSEERGMKASDLMDLMNEGPDGAGPPSSSPAASSKIPVAKPKNKLVAQGNEEKSSMRTSDLIDIMNEAPPGDPTPLAKSSPAKSPPPASKASSVKKGPTKAPVISVNPISSSNEEPVIVKKRVKPKDPYDIDQMMADIENEEDLDE